ncbi:Peroxisome biogenesis factor [Arachis hypogaea]|nr:Peroxisome biogenesis factor [Arachis hypogaea]
MAVAKLVLVAPSPQPLPAQPEMMRAAEKDEQQNLFRGNVLLCSHNRVQGSRRLGRSTVTPLSCFGELPAILNLEKLLIVFLFTVAGAYGLPPTPARRTIFIVYQTAIPYIADHISS